MEISLNISINTPVRSQYSVFNAIQTQPEVDSSTGDLERWLKVAPEVGRLSIWELCKENLEGDFLRWEPWRIGRRDSGDGHLFP
jgi:hypothetical protein